MIEKWGKVKPGRRSIRLPHYDYTSAGAYFLTINTRKRQPVFGEITDGQVMLNRFGKIAEQTWQQIPQHFPKIELDAFVVMPDHVHGILWLIESDSEPRRPTRPASQTVRARHASPIQKPRGFKSGSLAAIVASYKSAVTKALNQQRGVSGQTVWHRNFYERVIRNQRELKKIRHYVMHNAAKWPLGGLGPTND